MITLYKGFKFWNKALNSTYTRVDLHTSIYGRYFKHPTLTKIKPALETILLFFRSPFGLFYHAAWFTQPHHKIGFETFLDTLVSMDDVWIVTSWQAIQYLRSLPNKIDPLKFEPFQCKQEVFLLHCRSFNYS